MQRIEVACGLVQLGIALGHFLEVNLHFLDGGFVLVHFGNGLLGIRLTLLEVDVELFILATELLQLVLSVSIGAHHLLKGSQLLFIVLEAFLAQVELILEADQLLQLGFSLIELFIKLLNGFLVFLEPHIALLGILLEFNVDVFEANRAII